MRLQKSLAANFATMTDSLYSDNSYHIGDFVDDGVTARSTTT